MTTSSPRSLALKRVAAAVLTSYPIARLIRTFYRDKIPSGSAIIDLTRANVPSRNHAMIFWNIYESAERRFVEKYLQKNVDTIEFGASLGVISSCIAAKLEPNRKLISVEANPRLQECLQSNFARNASHLKYEIVAAAVGYTTETISFETYDNNLVSRMSKSKLTTQTRQQSEQVDVNCVTLAKVLSRLDSDQFQFVCDIEGMEWELLAHDSKSLEKCSLAIIEAHDFGNKKYDEFFNAFQSTGLKLIDRYGAVGVFQR